MNERRQLWLFPLFFASGFAALLYQVVWQRALFTLYGTNVESVTVIVTAFMFGLGVGSLLGGWISKDPRRDVVRLFALAELGVGLFGTISLVFFRFIAGFTTTIGTFGLAAIVLVALALPTALMGATLPLLVSGAVRRSAEVGKSVGELYFVNTLGSACAALAAAQVLLDALGLQRTVYLAAAINFAAATLAVVAGRRIRVSV